MNRAVEKYYTVREAAWLLGFSPAWVRKKCEQGAFVGTVKIEADYRIPASGINAFLQARTIMQIEQALERVGLSARSTTELKRKLGGVSS
jgi:hypothetical protein